MNATQVDHLIQVTAIRPEPVGGSQRARGIAPPFDDHFRTAQDRSAALKPSSPPEPPRPTSAERRSSTAPSDESPQAAAENQDSALESEQPAAGTDQPSDESTGAEDHARDPRVAADSASLDESDTEQDENAEVAALLVKEQVAQVATAEDAVEEADLPAESATPDPSPENADAPAQAKTTAEAAATVADAVPVAQTESETPVEPGAERHPDARQADVVAKQRTSQEPTSELEAAIEPPDEGQEKPSTTNEKRRAATHVKLADRQPASEPVADQPPAETNAAVARPVAPEVERQAASPRGEKKSAARSLPANGDAQASPVERPVGAAQIPDATTTAPIAASAQQPSSAKVSGDAASAANSISGPKEAKPGMLSSLAQLDRGTTGGTRGGHRAGQSESTPVVDPARFVSRVARAVQTAHERGGPLHLRLSPPELGALRLELTVDRGTLTAKIETENSNARQVLLDNLPALRDRLADQNIKVERFDVDVRRDPSGDSQNYAPQDGDGRQREQATGSNRSQSRHAPAPLIDEPAPVRRTISSTSINVVA